MLFVQLTKLIKEGWSFPELVLTLPLNELLKKTIIPEVPTTTTTTRAAATASAIPPVIPTSNAILPDKNSSANTDSTSGTNSSAIGGDKQFDGVNLNSLMWPLLIPRLFLLAKKLFDKLTYLSKLQYSAIKKFF